MTACSWSEKDRARGLAIGYRAPHSSASDASLGSKYRRFAESGMWSRSGQTNNKDVRSRQRSDALVLRTRIRKEQTKGMSSERR
jgi:hypothetical protein